MTKSEKEAYKMGYSDGEIINNINAMNFRCTISNIDDDCLRYLMGIIEGMRALNVATTPDTIEFSTDGTNVALLVDLHQRDILRCDISYGRIRNTI